MCGIAGLFHPDGRPADHEVVQRMTRALAHRGPDGEGLWIEGCVGFGHRRLAIRDLSDGGRQPMSDDTGRVTVVFNGEIYNDLELRRNLERDYGVRFRTTCDTELIPYGWRAWGEDLFPRIEGMFAIALWDAERCELVLARDGVGIKPLYVADAAADGAVRFGSELKALIADPRLGRGLEPAALRAFLAQGYVAPDGSLLRGVGQVPPGTVRIYGQDGTRRERRFWQPSRRPDIRSREEAVDAFLAVWPDVVASQLGASDVPVGILQSGGIDSSLVTLAASRHRETPLFVASFHQARFDESDAAAQVAATAGMRLHRVPVAPEQDAEQRFRDIVAAFDGQLADSSGFAVHALMRGVADHVKVVLSGDGGDEFFGGYETYTASRAAAAAGIVPSALLNAVGRLALAMAPGGSDRIPPGEKIGRFAFGVADRGAHPHAQWRRMAPPHVERALWGRDLRAVAGHPLAAYDRAIGTADGATLVDRCLLADQMHYLPADMLMKVDALSMAHGVEVRVPFLDRRVMDLAARMDVRVLAPFSRPGKVVLRDALRRLGGPSAVVGDRKRGFNVPLALLLRGPLRELADRRLLREADRLAPWLEPAAVAALWKSHRDGLRNHGYIIWTILTFAVWRKQLEDSSPT